MVLLNITFYLSIFIFITDPKIMLICNILLKCLFHVLLKTFICKWSANIKKLFSQTYVNTRGNSSSQRLQLFNNKKLLNKCYADGIHNFILFTQSTQLTPNFSSSVISTIFHQRNVFVSFKRCVFLSSIIFWSLPMSIEICTQKNAQLRKYVTLT